MPPGAGLIMKSSGGKKAHDGAELVRVVEDWQMRLFTLGRDIEGVPMLNWYKDMDQYKMRKKPQNTLILEKVGGAPCLFASAPCGSHSASP